MKQAMQKLQTTLMNQTRQKLADNPDESDDTDNPNVTDNTDQNEKVAVTKKRIKMMPKILMLSMT